VADLDDPFDLERYVRAQASTYEQALAEIRGGRKRSHWMWFVFPQFDGLGASAASKHYAVKTVAEARAYLAHPVLGARLIECADSLLALDGRTAFDVLGSPDDLKLRSSATLFAHVSGDGSVFHRLLAKFFQGRADERTLGLIRDASGGAD